MSGVRTRHYRDTPPHISQEYREKTVQDSLTALEFLLDKKLLNGTDKDMQYGSSTQQCFTQSKNPPVCL